MGTVEKRLKTVTANYNSDDNKLRQFEEATKEFNDLVSRGIAKSRGYNLPTVNSYQETVGVIGFNLH